MARQAIAYGAADCILIIGFEKMMPGSLKGHWLDRESPLGTTSKILEETKGVTNSPWAAQVFGNAAREYIEKYGAKEEDFAEIARVNHEHSKRNPYSQFTEEYNLKEIMESPMIFAPLTKLQCCPTSDGGAAAVLVSQEFLDQRPHLKSQAVLIAGQCMATDAPDLFNRSAIDLIGYKMSEYAAKEAFKQAGITPEDVSVVELHDCFSANEMCLIDAMGLSPKGKAHELVRTGGITYGGKYVINPSGGLISKGHPLGKLESTIAAKSNHRLTNSIQGQRALHNVPS
jgi:sterol carrier protein 2